MLDVGAVDVADMARQQIVVASMMRPTLLRHLHVQVSTTGHVLQHQELLLLLHHLVLAQA